MITTTTKRGRPQGFHRTSWGDRIDGLTRLADGRWKVSSGPKTKPVKFTEPDERLAVARAYQILSSREQPTIRIPRASARLGDNAALQRAVSVFPTPKGDETKTTGIFLPPNYQPEPDPEEQPGTPISMEVKGDQLVFLQHKSQAAAFFAWLRETVLTRGEWLARMTGVPALGWLGDVEQPTDSPKLDEVGELYANKPGLSPEEATRAKRIWIEFVRIVGVSTVREIKHEQVEIYEAKINTAGLGPKSIKHRYSKVKTILAYALKRGKGAEHCRKALDTLAMLEVETPDSLDPDPITPKQFWAIHNAATDAGNQMFAAMMLFAINTALYPSEAGAVRWDEIDLKRGVFATRRRKTSVPRIGVLWPETIAAIKKLPRTSETVFNTCRTNYKRFSVFRDWCKYREVAKLGTIKFNQIRDAAFTSACRVSLDQARALAGHRMPGAVDAYVLRQPQFVADACAAIRREFCRPSIAASRGVAA